MWKFLEWYWDQTTVRPFGSVLSRVRAHVLLCVSIGVLLAIALSLVAALRVLPSAASQVDHLALGLLSVFGTYLLMGALGVPWSASCCRLVAGGQVQCWSVLSPACCASPSWTWFSKAIPSGPV